MRNLTIENRYRPDAKTVLYHGDCFDLLRTIPASTVQLVVTSPPYNLGKAYEKRDSLETYLEAQSRVITQCVRVLHPAGSLCWQVGNYISKKGTSSIVPLDIALYPIFAGLGLRLRNRIIWHFEHGLHCEKRFSGRYETVLWFTKSDDYVFNLDPVRVPQKYPGKKYFKGPKAGQFSCNPLGKNPGDLWVIPNVKNNHVEKTGHPCQFPIELVERLVLSLTNPGDWVLDPFVGVGSSIIAANRHGRRGAGSELMSDYVTIAAERIQATREGTLPVRPMHKPIYDPKDAGKGLTTAPWLTGSHKEPVSAQFSLLETPPKSSASRK